MSRSPSSAPVARSVSVEVARFPGWVDGFAARRGGVRVRVEDGGLAGTADDGSWFVARLPFGSPYGGPPEAAPFAGAATPPRQWGVLLVRKGGFAIARLAGDRLERHKIGQRHVQGRTKAGGQSQQRFARRRDNQARQAFEAAAEHAVTILGRDQSFPVVTGGDHAAVEQVLADRRLASLSVVEPWLPLPDPRRKQLDDAVVAAQAIRVEVWNAPAG